MADVAKEAGVSRQAVYLHFPSRAELLVATTRHIDEVEDVAGMISSVRAQPSGRAQLEKFVQVWGNYIPTIYGGAKRLLAIRETDADANAAWQDRMTGLHGLCADVVASLAADGDLSSDLTTVEATDVMWTVASVRHWELLRIERGMSQARYLELTHRTLIHVLTQGPLGG